METTRNTQPPTYELLATYPASLLPAPQARQGQTWGPWRFNARKMTIRHRDIPSYKIDLKTVTTSAEMLDLLFQVSAKFWCSERDAGHLLAALRAVLNPQATVWSRGIDKKFNPN
jgi:hypothetical protein